MDRRSPEIGNRISIRYANTDNESTELVGFVVAADADGLRLRTRDHAEKALAWAQIQAWRTVGVARGRDPLRTPVTELDQLADIAGVTGRVFVVRLSQLLDAQPPQLGTATGVRVDREWATAPAEVDLFAAAWWAARLDARSLQVRTNDPTRIAELLAAGFTEVH